MGFFLKVIYQVMILFMAIAVGFLLKKKNLLSDKGSSDFTNLLLYVVNPCLIVKAMLNVKYNAETGGRLLLALLCAAISFAVGIFISILCIRSEDRRKRAVLRFAAVFSNCGFMSLPLASALTGDEGVFLVSVYVALFNVVLWTYGVYLFRAEQGVPILKAFLNPGVISIVIGLPLFFLNIKLPYVLDQTVSLFAELNAPLAMVVIGNHLANSSLKPKKGDSAMWVSILLRLLSVPIICLIIYRIMGINGNTLLSVMIPVCAPAAANSILMSIRFDGDTEMASRIVSLSTLCSIITLPLLLMASR